MNPFAFKHFELSSNPDVFPLTTDSVLLASWIDIESAKNILDVGCGTGILSLILAQRTSPDVKIQAVDINLEAYLLATSNFINSPWKNKLCSVHGDITKLIFPDQFDLIICNPPYFTNGIVSPSESKRQQRHQLQINFYEFASVSSKISTAKGRVGLVVPILALNELIYQMLLNSYHLVRKTIIRHTNKSEESLALILFSKEFQKLKTETIILFDDSGNRTPQFMTLVNELYL